MKLGSPLSAAISRAGESGGGRCDTGAGIPAMPSGLACFRLTLDSFIRTERSFTRIGIVVSTPIRFVGD